MADEIAHIRTKRFTVFLEGCDKKGRSILIDNDASLTDLVRCCCEKFLGSAENGMSLYSPQGGLIDDITLIRDDDVLHLCKRGAGVVDCILKSELRDSKKSGDWIRLNVGGTCFVTTRATLTTKEPCSMLARMFNQDSQSSNAWSSSVDDTGAYLIDRSPKYFEPLLNYLRHGELVIDSNISPKGVLEEAKFFGIESLTESLEQQIIDTEPASDHTPFKRHEFCKCLLSTSSKSDLRCQGMNFKGANLSKLDLRHINFKYAIMKHANLTGANISQCNFERADMSGTILDGANLSGAKMVCVNLENASMRGCNFEDPTGTRSNMEGAIMKGVNLEGSQMAGINLRVANLKNANLQNCDLRTAVLAGADLENCDLSGCDLHEANLRGANLKDATFELMLNPLHMSQTIATQLS